MTFTYADALSTDRDKIRLRIGDTQADEGPRPDRRNFSDGEIDFVLTEETTITACIAHCFEILRDEWTPFALSERAKDATFDAKGVADNFASLALFWRAKPGGTPDATAAPAYVTLEREDAYTVTSGEYS